MWAVVSFDDPLLVDSYEEAVRQACEFSKRDGRTKYRVVKLAATVTADIKPVVQPEPDDSRRDDGG